MAIGVVEYRVGVGGCRDTSWGLEAGLGNRCNQRAQFN